jgi:uncharacterized membrane protein YsdA (DUF1294 family)
MTFREYLLIAICAWVACWSLAAFIAFGIDKRAARLGRRRVSEFRLHCLEIMGGWPGAFLGAVLLNHKIAKASYMLVLALIVMVWAAAAWLIWWSWG